jgi:hypothetical protein
VVVRAKQRPGHDKSRYLAWRRRYQPAPIELIIVAESPPKSGKYFYDPDGSHRREILFREMMKQLKVTCSSKDEGLRAFQKRGLILVDALQADRPAGTARARAN